VITGDHTSHSDKEYFYSQSGHYEIPLLVYSPGVNIRGNLQNQLDSTIKIAKSKTLSQCDILPTVWSLLGSSNGKSNVQPRLGFGHSAFDPNYKGYSTHFDKDLYYIIQYPYVLALNQRGEVVDYHQQLRNQRQGKPLSQKGPKFEWMRATLQAQMHEYSRRIRENQWR
jgi:phosphoglycerol transferase MdoB-like AlkP superfamily enzyme